MPIAANQLLLVLMLFSVSACGGGGGAGQALPAAAANAVSGTGAAPSASPGGSSAKPVGTAAPTAAPTSGAVAVLSTSTYLGFANATDWATSFMPYAATSVFNAKVSDNPTFLANSAAIVAAQFPSGLQVSVRSTEAGQYDYSHPRYFATTSDPVVKLVCNQYCGAPDNGGVPATAYIPAVARPAGGSDAHFDVVQPNGTDITMWAAECGPSGCTSYGQPNDMQGNWTAGSTLTAGNIANCGSFTSGLGYLVTGPGPTAADFCTNAMVITAAELIAGRINHAMSTGAQCAIGTQFPAAAGSSTQQCTSGVGPPLGGREWYDVPDATTNATNLQPWEKAILNALHDYGAFFGDNGSGGANYTGGFAGQVESEEPWRDYNGTGTNKATYTSPFALLAAQGWIPVSISNAIGTASGTRWIGADPWNIWTELGETEAQFASHIHWLDPCSARGTC
jgi:hypothetical protein